MKMTQILLLVLLFLLIMTILISCVAQPKPSRADGKPSNIPLPDSTGTGMTHGKPFAEDAVLDSFSFSHNGSSMSECYSYELRRTEGGAELTVAQAGVSDPMTVQLDDTLLTQLMDLMRTYDLQNWDGYSLSENYLLDGDGFSLHAVISDGRSISAHGYGCVPKGYTEFTHGMEELLYEYRLQLLEEAGLYTPPTAATMF